MQYSLVGSRFVLQYKLYCEPGWACVTIQHGLGSWGAGVGAGRAGVGEAGARQGAQVWALGRACWASGRRRGRRAARRAGGRRRQGRAGWPAGRPVHVWCAQLGQVGCFGAPDSVFGLV